MSNNKTAREFFDSYAYKNDGTNVAETHTTFCRVDGKSLIVSGQLRFVGVKTFMNAVVRMGMDYDLYNTCARALKDEHSIRVLVKENNVWTLEYVSNMSSLMTKCMKNIVDNNAQMLIPYFHVEGETAMNVDEFIYNDLAYLDWPILSTYQMTSDKYQIVSFEDFIKEFSEDKNYFNKVDVYLNLDYVNHKSIITPADLYVFDSGCEPVLRSEIHENKLKSEELHSDLGFDAIEKDNTINKCDDDIPDTTEYSDKLNADDIFQILSDKNIEYFIPNIQIIKDMFKLFGLDESYLAESMKVMLNEIINKFDEAGLKVVRQ